MQLFYTPNVTFPTYRLDKVESNHAVRVLRMGVGDHLWLTNGEGTLHKAVIVDANPKGCMVEVVESVEQFGKRSYGLTMAVAPPKNVKRFEWFLEKATEIGCDRFVPLVSFHSERRVLNLERTTGVVTAAMKQSLKAYHPAVEPMTEFRELVEQPFEGVKLIAHCYTEFERVPFKEAVAKNDNVLILIGPEGDFSKEEINFALTNGFRSVTLGDSRLRIETAALMAVAGVAFVNQ